MSYRPKHLGHVNIFVRDAERSRRWYEDVLGLHTYGSRAGQVAFMAADLEQSHEVALVQIGEEAAGPQRDQVGLNHFAWMMSSLEDLKEFYQRLRDRGVAIERVADHGISIGIYFRDPDGNGLEVSYELPPNEWPRHRRLFDEDLVELGRFPGPWDEHPSRHPTASR
jgi:catechol 2,3-dioxygenase